MGALRAHGLNSLRTRIILPFTLLVIAAVLVPGLIAVHQGVKTLTAKAEETQLLAARMAAHHLTYLLREQIAVVQGIAREESLRQMAPAGIDADIRKVRLHEKTFTSLIVIDPAGKILSCVDKPWNVGKSLAQREYFQIALQQGRTYISDSILTLDKTITVVVSTPLRNDAGNIVGVLAGAFDVHHPNFKAVFLDTGIGAAGYACLVDRQGIVLAHPETKRSLEQENFAPYGVVREVLAGKTGTAVYTFEGTEMLAAYAPVEPSGWGVIVQQPLAAATARAVTLRRFLLAVALVDVVIAGFLGILLFRWISAPLARLESSAATIATGNLEEPVPALGRDEIGRLAGTLDEMRLGLKESRAQLVKAIEEITVRRQIQHRLARLNDCFLSFGSDTAANIQKLVETGGQLLGADCALYNRLQGSRLYSLGQWQTPPDYQEHDEAEGHLCFDVITKSADQHLVVRNLQTSPYAKTDPNVGRYLLETYVGVAVRCRQVPIGSLCVVYQSDIEPGPDDLNVLTILAAAIRVEEERHETEGRLFREEEKYQTLAEESSLGIAIIGESGDYKYLNHKFIEMFGYALEDIPTGREWFARAFPDAAYRQQVLATWIGDLKKAKQGEARPRTFPVTCKDGSEKIINFRSVTLGTGDQLVIYNDLTEKMQAEEAFQALVNGAPLGIFILQNGRFKHVNPGFVKICGSTEEELIGSYSLDLVPPDYRAEVRRNAIRMLKGETLSPYEFPIFTRSGETRWILEKVTSMVYQGQRAVLGYFLDISERKSLESQFLQAQKMEAVGRLAGGVAHDFNNLLSVILGYSDIIKLGLHKDDPLTHNLAEIEKAAQRAATLTQQLLAFSRKQIIEPQVINLNTKIAGMEKMLRRLLGEDIDLALVLDPSLEAVRADPGQFDQIIMNLAVNARDAMPHGGRLIMETANVNLDEAYVQTYPDVMPGPYVMLAVSDNGQGMDAITQTRIFEPFFTTKQDDKGSGLGLATVYGIVKQNNGHIQVYSEVGRGTTFKMYLPPVQEAVPPIQPEEPRVEKLHGLETILVVEDEDSVRNLICRSLRGYGYNVLDARNGGEALLQCERFPRPIHLILTDVVMPHMSGRELVDRLKLLRPDLKVLYMSGYTANSVVSQGIIESAVFFLQKPFPVRTLVERIRQILDETIG